MAMAARRERGLFDPDAAPGESPFDHHIYVIAGDGCLEEGISSEASSLAGHQQLGNLILFYDDNHISIEDDTAVAFSEDVLARYEAYGWHVQQRRLRRGRRRAREGDRRRRKAVTDQPSIIVVRTIIGWPAPTKQNTGKAHGSALGEDEIRATKEILGFDPDVHFAVDDDVLAHARQVVQRGRDAHAAVADRVRRVGRREPRARRAARAAARPAGCPTAGPPRCRRSPTTKDGKPNSVSTRAASGKVLTALADVAARALGRLGRPRREQQHDDGGRSPASSRPCTRPRSGSGGPYGRTLHFGIREHAMGAILNGITLHGGTRVYGGTFLVFSDYMRPPVRLAALMKIPSIFVWTHDSIGLGGDGPTHQPIEHLAALRAIPGSRRRAPGRRQRDRGVLAGHPREDRRPGRASRCRGRTCRCSTRPRPSTRARARYILEEGSTGLPEVILVATGSEVSLALQARERSRPTARRRGSCRCRASSGSGPSRRPTSSRSCRRTSRPGSASRPAVPQGWREVVGDAGEIIAIDHFGASAEGDVLFEQFGFTPDRVVAAAHAALERAGRVRGTTTGN